MEQDKVRRNLLGYLPEERGLYQDIPVIRNLVYLAGLRGVEPGDARAASMHWLTRLDLADRAEEKVTALSKGNQQKVQFIASIVHRPKFAILDEPFSGFDPINQELISSMIRELRDQGMTILLSAHQMQLVERIADRILLLNRGRELLSGTLADIRRQTVAGKKLTIGYESDTGVTRLDRIPGVSDVQKNVNGDFSVYLQDDASLSVVLTALSAAGRIRSLQSIDISLHEIYLHSFSHVNEEQTGDGTAVPVTAGDEPPEPVPVTNESAGEPSVKYVSPGDIADGSSKVSSGKITEEKKPEGGRP
jgi:ABC-2 type transport system ATP-binding protein